MYLLAIETTGAFASVALAKAEIQNNTVNSFEIIGHIDGHDKFSHLQNLTPQIQQVLSENALSIGDVSVIATSVGPGSFTGIRIGVSTARALSQALGIPCAAVPSLEAMALRFAGAKAWERVDANTLVCPIIDARRSQIYGGGFCMNTDGVRPEAVIPPGPYLVDDFIDAIGALNPEAFGGNMGEMASYRKVLFMGDGIDKYQNLIEELKASRGLDNWDFTYADEAVRYQDADTVARIGAELAAAGETCSFEALQPEYMRLAEAERKLKEKQKETQKNG